LAASKAEDATAMIVATKAAVIRIDTVLSSRVGKQNSLARLDQRMSAFIPDFLSNGIFSIESLRIPYHRLRKRLPGCGPSRPGPYWRYHWFWTQKVFVPLAVILHCS
jgi:hypothetical protein